MKELSKTTLFPSFKDFMPERARFFMYMLMLFCFQFAGGIYFCAMQNMAAALSFSRADMGMLTASMLAGVTMYFPLAFRLKFRFCNQHCLLAAFLVLAAINIVSPAVKSLPLWCFLCFFAGFFRLFGTFECLSSMLPKIAPTHNYSVFLSFVFFVVLGLVHAGDIAASRILYYWNWMYIHYFAALLLLFAMLLAWFLMKKFRPMPMQALFGVDWAGMLTLSASLLSIIFVILYCKELDYMHSARIRMALGMALIFLACFVWRILRSRHPFVSIAAFKTRNLVNLLLLFLILDILLASQATLQNIFTSQVMHLDYLSTIDLYWWDILGAFCGAIFSWFTLSTLKWTHKMVCFCGMAAVVVYLLLMYALIAPLTALKMLYVPLIFCGFGHVVVFIALTVYAQATAMFKVYFQVLCLLGLVRTGVGSVVGDMLLEHYFDKTMLISSSLELSLRQLYWYAALFGMASLLLILLSRFKKHAAMLFPSMRRVYVSMFTLNKQ